LIGCPAGKEITWDGKTIKVNELVFKPKKIGNNAESV